MRLPLQNRVTPTGDIIATPHRGMFTGNRGIIHDPATKTLTRRWAGKAWLTCVCEFRGRRRKVMGGTLMCGIRSAAVLEFVSDMLCQTSYVKLISNYASRRLPSSNAPHHEPCQRVDHDGDKE